jgi:hypothetical protein
MEPPKPAYGEAVTPEHDHSISQEDVVRAASIPLHNGEPNTLFQRTRASMRGARSGQAL